MRLEAWSIVVMAAACGGPVSAPAPVEIILRDGTGNDVGQVRLRERDGRVQVYVRVTGMAEGEHGIHLHAVGRCDGPDFQTAGGHLNPTGMQHGHLNPQGPHFGDLGNIRVGADGRGEKTIDLLGGEARAGIGALLGTAGIALVVHAGRDDERTDPAGNSGARIACAAILP